MSGDSKSDKYRTYAAVAVGSGLVLSLLSRAVRDHLRIKVRERREEEKAESGLLA